MTGLGRFWGVLGQASAVTPGGLIWGSPTWVVPIAIVALVLAILIAVGYWQGYVAGAVRATAAALKLLAIAAIALCVVEPMFSGTRPRPGANLFLVVGDNSKSLTMRDQAGGATRGEQLQQLLRDDVPWLVRLGQDFELRRYIFDSRWKATESFAALNLQGESTTLSEALASIAGQFRDRPVAGVMLLTDGNPTDWNEAKLDWSSLPPIYPVMLGEDRPPRDVNVTRVSVTQTNFESHPVTVQAYIDCRGVEGEELVLQLRDEAGHEIQRETVTAPRDSKPLVQRFQFRPAEPGVSFYEVRVIGKSEESLWDKPQVSREATLANNSRLALVDRGRGPYRVLYVGGRPNWDFKFLRRAVGEDPEVDLLGLMRIAKKEAKFTFKGHLGERTNPLYRGFENQTDQTAEQYDEPVLVRMGRFAPDELRAGFPKAADQLYSYHALIVDDVEAAFFTRDQMSLMQQFVSQRGGGLLMLGGEESFGGGGYARTPIGEMLPVYLEKSRAALPAGEYRLGLSREGWLQPWVRLRANETDEDKRLASMPGFRVWNAAASIKPGATVLIQAQSSEASSGGRETVYPALVTQRFGRGQTAALLVGDLWRWGLRRETTANSDLEMAWRQMIRWLVSDVPQRVSVETRQNLPRGPHVVQLQVSVRDEEFQALDNAEVVCEVRTPNKKTLQLTASPLNDQAGEYVAELAPREPGAYHITVHAKSADAQEIGSCETGVTHEPATDEFRELRPNRELLTRIAERTGGELVEPRRLDSFVANLPNQKIPITEPWVYPLWHQWPVLGLALLSLIGEWGLRRWKGMP